MVEKKPDTLNFYKTMRRCGKCSGDFDTKQALHKTHKVYGVICGSCDEAIKAKKQSKLIVPTIKD